GLFTGADVKKLSEAELTRHFGKPGKFFYKIVRGIDDRPVTPNRETKSVGAEDTFPEDLTTTAEMFAELDKIAEIVHQRLQAHALKGKTITLKIKYSDFRIVTRSLSLTQPIDDRDIMLSTAKQLLVSTAPEGDKIRLLGISLSNFGETLIKTRREESTDQLKLF
ncbi:MAG: DNA polymerase IV, partial [Bacteroidota bacterium]